jgi:hypothetical protein
MFKRGAISSVVKSTFVTCLLATAATTATTSVAVAESTTLSTAPQTSGKFNKQFSDDRTLTDSKLRADDGSLSRFSLKGSFGYAGPILGDLDAKNQPNPDGTVGNDAQNVSGSVVARMRLSSSRTISAGTGIYVNHPFEGDQYGANNPFLAYDMSSKIGAIEMRNSPGISAVTVPNYIKIGEIAGLTYSNSLIYRMANKFSVGLDSAAAIWIFSRAYRASDRKAEEYRFSLTPVVKYNLSDSVTINSSVYFKYYNPRQLEDKVAIWNSVPSLRLGASYAYDRKAYFSPYVQMYPDRFSWQSTTINFSTVFSLL